VDKAIEEVFAGASLWCLKRADCRKAMEALPDSSVDALITDPPYELGFLSNPWDRTGVSFEISVWQQAWRVVKPGGFLLAFGSTRTVHRLACAIEDAGWQIRDHLAWLYATGFNKTGYVCRDGRQVMPGWGGSLKPAMELVCVGRKPFDGTLAQNLRDHRTGAFNVDGCRIELPPNDPLQKGVQHKRHKLDTGGQGWGFQALNRQPGLGRWPANVLHDGSPEVRDLLATYGASRSFFQACPFDATDGEIARFFFGAKASRRDKDEGLDRLRGERRNIHPTVKPTALMRYLVRLITPAGGIVLDPFAGSGSSGKAALAEGMRFVGFELNPQFARIATARLKHAAADRPKARHAARKQL
jgi:site-specific DNA-methyltransferase (adenine-specific)